LWRGTSARERNAGVTRGGVRSAAQIMQK
jgi:hypothetical protein